MIKGHKIRIYPTKTQEQLMFKHIGSCRYIWNYMLDIQIKRYKDGEKHLSGFDMINLLKPLKNDGEHTWLKEVSNASLKDICIDLSKAYKSMFNKTSKAPRFKSRKRSKAKFPIRTETVYFKDGKVNIEKIGKVKYKTDFELPQGRGNVKVSNARIGFESNKWYITFGIECENQAYDLTEDTMGIDLGVKDLAAVVCGEDEIVFHNINKSKKMRNIEKRIITTQRSISRKYESNKVGNKYNKTRNIEREEEELRKLYRKQRNIRNNYLHQTTHKLVSMNPKRIVMEDLNVKGMMSNHKLAKAVSSQNFYEFIRQMKYKSENRGIEFIQADRYFPSSKTCSCCGEIKKDLKLKDRVFRCSCGYVKDRDMNAAINLSRYVC